MRQTPATGHKAAAGVSFIKVAFVQEVTVQNGSEATDFKRVNKFRQLKSVASLPF